jgi:hypothetical protein
LVQVPIQTTAEEINRNYVGFSNGGQSKLLSERRLLHASKFCLLFAHNRDHLDPGEEHTFAGYGLEAEYAANPRLNSG